MTKRPSLIEIRRTLARYLAEPPARLLAKTGLSPNCFTLLGFALTLGVAAILATGHLFLGGFLVLVAAAFDLLDGAVARACGRTTRFGALLDSVIDRLSEAALFFGLLIHYAQQPSLAEVLLINAALIGSVMISYVRARAEGLGLSCEVGIFTRPERVIVLALGLIVGQALIALWILAVGTNLTALQRIAHVWRQTRGS